ncbi:MAG TPA: hypothetical protein VMW38_11820 [Terriglobia bacterium]|nr:hypothetical protein [Terriglobia bacterium]
MATDIENILVSLQPSPYDLRKACLALDKALTASQQGVADAHARVAKLEAKLEAMAKDAAADEPEVMQVRGKSAK